MKTLKKIIDSFEKPFNSVNEGIYKLPTSVEYKTEGAKLFNFKSSISSEEVIQKMKEEGYCPANAQELFLWAKDTWDGKKSVVALGSVSADSHVPVLYGDVGGGRCAHLWSWSYDWNSEDWFLAFRDSSLDILNSSTSDSLTLVGKVFKTESGELRIILD